MLRSVFKLAIPVLCILAAFVAEASPLGPLREYIVFQGTIGDVLPIDNGNGQTFPALEDPYGHLGGIVSAGDPVTVRVSVPAFSEIALTTIHYGDITEANAHLFGSSFIVEVGPYRWVTSSSNTDGSPVSPSLSIHQSPTMYSFSLDAGMGRQLGAPILASWDAGLGFVRFTSDPTPPIPVDHVELPGLDNFHSAALTVNGYSVDGSRQDYTFRANLTSASVAPIPEPTSAAVFAISLGVVVAWSRRQRIQR